jgi:hypothetical protein
MQSGEKLSNPNNAFSRHHAPLKDAASRLLNTSSLDAPNHGNTSIHKRNQTLEEQYFTDFTDKNIKKVEDPDDILAFPRVRSELKNKGIVIDPHAIVSRRKKQFNA